MRFIVLFLLFYSGLVNAQGAGLCSDDNDDIADYICDSRKTPRQQLEKELSAECVPVDFRSVKTFIDIRESYDIYSDDEDCDKYSAADMAKEVKFSLIKENDLKATSRIINNIEKDCSKSDCKQINYVKDINSILPLVDISGAIARDVQGDSAGLLAPMLPSRTTTEQECVNCLSKNISNFNIEPNEDEKGLEKLNDYIYEGMRKSIANRYMLFLEDQKLTDSDVDPDACLSRSKISPFLNDHEKKQYNKMATNQKVDIHQCENGKKITLQNYKDLSMKFTNNSKGHISDVIQLLSNFEGISLSSELAGKVFNKSRGEIIRADELLYLAADKSYIESLNLESMNLSESDKKIFQQFKTAAQKVSATMNKPGDIISLINTAVNEDPNFKYLLSGPVHYVMKSKEEGSVHGLYKSINLKNNKRSLSKPLNKSINAYCEQLTLDLERLDMLKKAKDKTGIVSKKSGSYQLGLMFKDRKINKILSIAIDTYQKKHNNLNGLSYEKLGKLKCKSGESYIHSPANTYPFHSGLEYPSSEALTLPKIDDSKRRFFLNNYCKNPEYYHRNASRISRYNKKWNEQNCLNNECNTETYQGREDKNISKQTLNRSKMSSVGSRESGISSKVYSPSTIPRDESRISGTSRLNSLGQGAGNRQVSNLNNKIKADKSLGSLTQNKKQTNSLNTKVGERLSNLEKENKLLKQNQVLRDKLASLKRIEKPGSKQGSSVGTNLRAPASQNGVNAINSQTRDFINQSTSNIAGYAKANVTKDVVDKSLANIKGNIREETLNGIVSLKVDSSINSDSSLDQIYEKLKDYDLAIIKEALDAKMPVRFVDIKGDVLKTIEVNTDEYDLLIKRFNEVSPVVEKEKPLSSTRLEYLNLIKASEELTQN